MNKADAWALHQAMTKFETSAAASSLPAPAQPDAQHAGPAAPPGTPSPLPSWSEQPLSAENSSPQICKGCKLDQRICHCHQTTHKFNDLGVCACGTREHGHSQYFKGCPLAAASLSSQNLALKNLEGAPKISGHVSENSEVRIQEAVLAERERCAKIAEEYGEAAAKVFTEASTTGGCACSYQDGKEDGGADIAELIRSGE